MKITELFPIFGNYNRLIQVGYWDESGKEHRSGLMKVGNVTYRHIDNWTFKKEVALICPCTNEKGIAYFYIKLRKVDNER